MTNEQIQADIRRMERFICERIQPGRPSRVVMADGPDGPAWVDLSAFWDDEWDCTLLIDTNEPNAFGLRDVYEHLRRQETTGWEQERELASEMNRWKLRELEGVMDELGAKGSRTSTDAEELLVDGEKLPEEVSTAEAARILGISKDTVLKMKATGLLEYRITGSPDSARPVFAFSLRSVLAVRTTYVRDIPPYHPPKPPHRHQVKAKRKYKNFTLLDD